MSDEKKCPFCAESIKSEAIKCRYCGSELAGGSPPTPSAPGPSVAACTKCNVALVTRETKPTVSLAGLVGAAIFLFGVFVAFMNLLFGVIIMVVAVIISIAGRGRHLEMVCPQCGGRSQVI